MALGPTARIDLDALRHNLQVARAAAPGRQVMAVVKADAYGHGLERSWGALADADALAVARIAEGLRLRACGYAGRLAVLEGCLDAAELRDAAQAGLELVIHHADQLDLLGGTKLDRPVPCWLKVDTGMHRLGFTPDVAPAAYETLAGLPAVAPGPRLITHLANADDSGDPYTQEQLRRFRPLVTRLGVPCSIANSAGILAWPDAHGDWVRPGLMLYGASPLLGGRAADHGLRPVMTLTTRLLAVNRLRAGDPVGYGGTWRCPEDMPVGVVGIGYGDGYPRELAPDTPVLVNGHRAAIVGRVSMDMLTVDLRELPTPRIGDPVVLWGEGLPVEEIAVAAGTIPYTLFCGVTARVQFQTVGSS